MPRGGIVLDPGSGGDSLETWVDPVTGRESQIIGIGMEMSSAGVLYVANSPMITWAATASLRPWGIFNPSGSGKTIYIRYIQAMMWAFAAATVIPVQMFRVSGLATSGTTITASRLDGAALSGNVAAVRSLVTAAAPPASGSVGRSMVTPATLNQVSEKMIWDAGNVREQMIPVAPNEALIWQVTGTPDADVRSWIDVFYEEAA